MSHASTYDATTASAVHAGGCAWIGATHQQARLSPASALCMRYRNGRLTRALLILLFSATQATAQTLTAGVDLLFYGDNTEFANQFRSGDTLLGTAGRVFVDAELNDTVTLRAGFFGMGRYGSHAFLEEAEPVIALELRRGPSRFVFGSLDTATTRVHRRGPDEDTPHGLLPPLQRETLTFTRAHEMGLQWRAASTEIDQDVWINWQRLNTPLIASGSMPASARAWP